MTDGGEANAETRRQLVHASMTLWIVALRWLTPVEGLVLAAAAVALNWVVLPLTGLDRGLRRADGRFVDGIKLYPVAVLVLLLLFPLPAAAAGWASMGLGDAASNVFGRRYGRPPLLGRPDRSLAGSVAFVATAAPGATLAAWWVADLGAGAALAAGCAAALAGAAAELLPSPLLDDNLPVALAAGAAAAGALLLVAA